MLIVNMDFGYAVLAILLFVQGSIGQETTEGDTLNFTIDILPGYKKLALNLGDSSILTCKVTTDGSEEPTLRWEFDGKPFDVTDSNERVYVEAGDKSLKLRFQDIKDIDNGRYTCIGSLAGKEDSRSVLVEIIKRLSIKSSKDQFGVKGTDGEIECIVTAKPAPSITWKMANGTIIRNSEKFIIQSGKLIVKNLEIADEAVYKCDITVSEIGDAKVLNIDYKVVEIPIIALPPTFEPNNPKVGDEVKIHCNAKGRPQPTYSFTKDGNTVSDDNIIDATNGILTIKDLKPEDEGVYYCIASNMGGKDEKHNNLDVKIPPVISEIQDINSAVEGSKQTIECVAEGDPAPTVSWKKKGMDTEYTETQDHPTIETENTDPSDAAIKVVKSTMTFDVKPQDAGEYVCTASNVVGSDTEEVKMGVTFKPHFDVDFNQDVFWGWRGHRANLTCQASANNLATFKWKKKKQISDEEEDIKNEPPYILKSPEEDKENYLSSQSLLVDIDDDDTFYGEYICEATNLIGTASKTLTLRQANVPSQPEVSVDNRLSTMVTIGVKKPDVNGGQPITEYKYNYYVDGSPEDKGQGNEDTAGDQTTINIKGLRAATTYVLKVTASNAVGEGAETTLTFTTEKVSQPLKLTIKSQPIGQSSNSYKLIWEEPDDGGSPITQFIVRYKQVKVTGEVENPNVWKISEDIDKDFTKQEVSGSSARSYEIAGLKKDAYYEIRLTAMNNEGESNAAQTIIKTIKGGSASSSDGNAATGNVDEEDASTGTSKEKEGSGDATNKSTAKGKSSASAGMDSGFVIGLIVGVILVLVIIVIIVFIVVKKRKAAAGGDAESGKKHDGKAAAESENLIQKYNAKVENENDKGDGIEEKTEFEPDQKPEQPADPVDAVNDKGDAPAEPTIQITPDTPEKAENPTA